MPAADPTPSFFAAPLPAETAGYTVFAAAADASIAGNPCTVIAGSQQDLAGIERSRLAQRTACLSWPVDERVIIAARSGGTETATRESVGVVNQESHTLLSFRVVCTNNGVEVQLCGHGLLATAHYWLDRLQARSSSFELSPVIARDAIVLLMGEHVIYVCDADNKTALDASTLTPQRRLLSARLPATELQAAVAPDWLTKNYISAMGEQSIAGCAQTSGANGYLLVEFRCGIDLAALEPFSLGMASEEPRAVIFVALVDKKESLPASSDRYANAGYQAVKQRYFAPQYGNAEDAATGSAARVVASYFADRYSQLFIQQQSASGGWLFTELDKTLSQAHLHLIGTSQRQEPVICQD